MTYIFAGPREAVLHALIMKNYGCTHALIGRDHAGIGDFYDKYASHSIFNQFTPEELGIDVRLFHEVFYCTRCDSPATVQTCPHDNRYRIDISGTGIREMLRHGIMPPKEIVPSRVGTHRHARRSAEGRRRARHADFAGGKTIKACSRSIWKYTRLGGPKRERAADA